jgi:predicted lipid-binding transport protein (Tim44 family)
MKLWTAFLAGALALGALDAEAARRIGGGGSIGRQSSNVTQRQSTPPATAPTAPSNAQRSTPDSPAATAAAQPQRSRWGGMLGGLAAGLGLAALAHALGFGAGFANFMLILLVGVLVLTAFAMMRRRSQPAPAGMPRGAYQNSGLSADQPLSPRQYNPQKVGNDASARPWESGFDIHHAQDAARGSVRIGSALEPQPQDALQGPQAWGIPAGFDTEGFLRAAKRNFMTLQEAWDRGDFDTLRGMMTDEMLHEIRNQLAERDRVPQAAAQKTEVEMLDAKLLGIEELASEYMASVEFSGMIREEPSAGPAPFREVWNMVKPRDGGSGWLVAGVQALQ